MRLLLAELLSKDSRYYFSSVAATTLESIISFVFYQYSGIKFIVDTGSGFKL